MKADRKQKPGYSKSIDNLLIQDENYRLKLVWEDENSVSYKLSNGEKYTVNLLKYVPELF